MYTQYYISTTTIHNDDDNDDDDDDDDTYPLPFRAPFLHKVKYFSMMVITHSFIYTETEGEILYICTRL